MNEKNINKKKHLDYKQKRAIRDKRYKDNKNNKPLKEDIQAKILMKLKEGRYLSYIRRDLGLYKGNKYLKQLIDDYNNKKIDVNDSGDLFVPSSNKTTSKTYVDTNSYEISDDFEDLTNKYPNILIIRSILTRLNLSAPQIKTIMIKYMSSSFSCDKNPEILYPTMIAIGVSQPKASLIINEIRNALFGTADDYSNYTNINNSNPPPTSNPNKSQFMINYDKTVNGYAPNNQPAIPIDPDEADMKRRMKFQRMRMDDMIAQAMETAIMMKVINAANTPATTPVPTAGSIVRQTPLIKDGAVVRDEYGNIVYITETVPINSATPQNTPEINPEIKDLKDSIQLLSNEMKEIKNMNKNNTNTKEDVLINTLLGYFKDVANKSLEEKKSMEDKYYNSLFTLLSENKKEVETKLKSLEQNSDPMSIINYFNNIKKVFGNAGGDASTIGTQLEIEKLRAESMRDAEKNRLEFERWKEEQRIKMQEKAEDLQLQRELKERELMFAKQTAEKNLSEMDRYMNFGEKIVNQFTPIAKEAMQGFIDAKSNALRIVKTDKEPNNNSNSNGKEETLNISELSDEKLVQIINNSNYLINKYTDEIIPAVTKELERRKAQNQNQ